MRMRTQLRLIRVVLNAKTADATNVGLALRETHETAVLRAAHGAAILSAPRIILRVGRRTCQGQECRNRYQQFGYRHVSPNWPSCYQRNDGIAVPKHTV